MLVLGTLRFGSQPFELPATVGDGVAVAVTPPDLFVLKPGGGPRDELLLRGLVQSSEVAHC